MKKFYVETSDLIESDGLIQTESEDDAMKIIQQSANGSGLIITTEQEE